MLMPISRGQNNETTFLNFGADEHGKKIEKGGRRSVCAESTRYASNYTLLPG